MLTQNGFDRPQENCQVESQRKVLDVVEVVVELFLSVCDRVAVFVAYLRPTSDSWRNSVSQWVKRDFAREEFDEFGTFGSRSNKTHVSTQHIPQLGNLIDPRRPQETTNTGDSRVLVTSPGGARTRLSIRAHSSGLIAMN